MNSVKLDWTLLPPQPRPRYDVVRLECLSGWAVVVTCSVVAVVIVDATVVLSELQESFQVVLCAAIRAETCLALLCLLGVQCASPGIIQRSEERCLPVPEGAIRGAILEEEGCSIIEVRHKNIRNPCRGSYCVRCLVWRRDEDQAHHCSTCQRCVRDFDHHCNLLGRCIAGKGLSGNMAYFRGLLGIGWLGFATVIISAMLAASKPQGRDQLSQWVTYAVVGISVLVGVVSLLVAICCATAGFFCAIQHIVALAGGCCGCRRQGDVAIDASALLEVSAGAVIPHV